MCDVLMKGLAVKWLWNEVPRCPGTLAVHVAHHVHVLQQPPSRGVIDPLTSSRVRWDDGPTLVTPPLISAVSKPVFELFTHPTLRHELGVVQVFLVEEAGDPPDLSKVRWCGWHVRLK